uniref:Uncharacterized protein n=1 Tax=Arundo donax TaxID=35708 RepID=A0A0A9HMR9_ARUDO
MFHSGKLIPAFCCVSVVFTEFTTHNVNMLQVL